MDTFYNIGSSDLFFLSHLFTAAMDTACIRLLYNFLLNNIKTHASKSHETIPLRGGGVDSYGKNMVMA
jgi:hypothetical protein